MQNSRDVVMCAMLVTLFSRFICKNYLPIEMVIWINVCILIRAWSVENSRPDWSTIKMCVFSGWVVCAAFWVVTRGKSSQGLADDPESNFICLREHLTESLELMKHPMTVLTRIAWIRATCRLVEAFIPATTWSPMEWVWNIFKGATTLGMMQVEVQRIAACSFCILLIMFFDAVKAMPNRIVVFCCYFPPLVYFSDWINGTTLKNMVQHTHVTEQFFSFITTLVVVSFGHICGAPLTLSWEIMAVVVTCVARWTGLFPLAEPLMIGPSLYLWAKFCPGCNADKHCEAVANGVRALSEPLLPILRNIHLLLAVGWGNIPDKFYPPTPPKQPKPRQRTGRRRRSSNGGSDCIFPE